MLSIIPDLSDSELSSDSSETCEAPTFSVDENKLKNECKQKDAGTGEAEEGLLLQSVPPRLQAELATTSTLKQHVLAATDDIDAGEAAAAVNSSTLLSDSFTKKFALLQEKRLRAAEEKVAEGYRKRRRRKRKFQGSETGQSNEAGCNRRPSDNLPCQSSSEGTSKKEQEHWDGLKRYLNVNSHMSQGVDHGHFAPDKSGLEKRLDEAVAEGDFDQAEKLSEELSVRELGCKIAKAADARDYMKWKTERDEEQAAKKRKKKKKLTWGFAAKNRWEMKANM